MKIFSSECLHDIKMIYTFVQQTAKHHEPQTHRSTVFKNHRKISTGRFNPISARYRWLCFNYNSMSYKISKLIVETFEVENPSLCHAIKLAVDANEPRAKFDAFIKSVIPKHEMSVLYPLSLTVFDYYKSIKP